MSAIEYTIEPSLHLMQASIDGSIRFLDLVNLLTRLRKDPQWGPAVQSLLIVDTSARMESVEPASLRSFFQKVLEASGSHKWAIVVLGMQYRSLFSDALGHLPASRVQLRMFDDEYTALRWLKTG